MSGDPFDDDNGNEPAITAQEIQKMELISSQSITDLDKEGARLRMVEHLYNTPEHRMGELTRLARHQIAEFTSWFTLDAALDPKRKPGNLGEIWRNTYFRLSRSIDGKHLREGIRLAEAGMLTDDSLTGKMALDI